MSAPKLAELRLALRAIPLAVALCLSACAPAAPALDGGGDSGVDSGVDAGMDAGSDAGPRRCNGPCRGESRCSVGGVAEIVLEDGEQGVCVARSEVIGGGPARWTFRPGGRALADRICTAQGLWPGSSASVRARHLELLALAGVRTVRLDFRWNRIEPERGRFDFAPFDSMLDDARAAGLSVIAILAYGNPWAAPAPTDDPFVPPADPADFARYAAALAGRYGDRVEAFEIWNEPNGGYRFWRPTTHGDAAAYAELLVQSEVAIHEVCADCRVISAGLFFHEQVINGAVEFLSDMLSARPGALDGVAAIGFHPYPTYPPSDDPERDGEGLRSMAGMIADLEDVVALRGGPSLPLAATELGWPSYGGVDEQRQASLLSRAHLLATALGVDPICWFNVADGPEHGTFPPEDDFGLYRFGSEDPALPIDPKPARDAMAWLASIGAGAIFAGPSNDPSLHDPDRGRFALHFDGPRGRVTALWRLEPGTIDLALDPRARFDHLGRELDGSAPLALGIDPVFLVPR